MSEPNRELSLSEIPHPPLYRLVDADGREVFQETEVGGESAVVAALFSGRELAGEFSTGAAAHGMGSLAELNPRELRDWPAVELFANAGADYVLVLSEKGAGLFYASDVARQASERAGELPFPLYLFSDERGEAPLISVPSEDEVTLVAALFSSAERARAFHEIAAHLELPDRLATIEDADGLRRHALVARQAGAVYAVLDPESGLAEAIPIDELIS